MNKTTLILIILTIMGFSCTYHNEEDLLGTLNCELENTNFSENVLPIIQNNCAIPTCHTNGGQQPDFSNFSAIATYSQLIKQRINNGTMPPPSSGKKLSKEEIRIINCWIDEGAQNN